MITESDLYYMGQESDVAHDNMKELCLALGKPYPPQAQQPSAWREQLPDPIPKGKPAPINAGIQH